jgi:hypothetical protein
MLVDTVVPKGVTMKKLIALVSFALVAAACGSDDTGSFDPDAAFSQGSEGELRTLAYAYQPDSRLEYDFTLDMDMVMSADIDAPDGFEEMTMGMSADGSMAYDVSAGAEPGTTVLEISPTLDGFSFSDFTIDGEAIAEDLAGFDDPDFAGIGEFIPPMTATLDSSGNIIEMQVGDVAVPSELLNAFGGGGLGDPSGMSMLGALFGPELPVDEVRVGATWQTMDTQEVPFMGEITVVTDHEIIGEESKAGRDTIVIRSTSQMSPLSVDFSEMLKALQDPSTMAALGIPPDELDAAQLEADLFEEMDFDFRMDLSYDDVTVTTWLDYEAGLTVATDGDIDMTMDMTIDMPDGRGSMSMDITMGIATLLTADGGSA